MRVVGSERDLFDRIQIVVDPDAEPGDVVGALAKLLIALGKMDTPCAIPEEEKPD